MKKLWNKFAFIMVSLILVGSTVAIANEYIFATVKFRVPSDVSFTVTSLGGSANYSDPTAPGNATTEIHFNDSGSGTDTNVEACVTGGSCQDAANPIFEIKNIGNVHINITLEMTNSSLLIAVNYNITVNQTNKTGHVMDFLANGTNIQPSTTGKQRYTTNLGITNISKMWWYGQFFGPAPYGTATDYVNFTSEINGS